MIENKALRYTLLLLKTNGLSYVIENRLRLRSHVLNSAYKFRIVFSGQVWCQVGGWMDVADGNRLRSSFELLAGLTRKATK